MKYVNTKSTPHLRVVRELHHAYDVAGAIIIAFGMARHHHTFASFQL